MSNDIGSIIRMVADDLHSPSTTVLDVLRRKICQVMRFHRDRRYWFSDRTCRFNLTAGRQTYLPGDGYGLPADCVEIASKTIWVLIGSSENQRQGCRRVDSTNWDFEKSFWGGNRSQPLEWTWNAGGLQFVPSPSSSTDVVEFRYLVDLGIPKVGYDNGAYTFRHPTTNALLTTTDVDLWSNDWTTQEGGQAAISARLKYEMEKTYLDRQDAAAETLASWLEMVGQLEDETESKTGGMDEVVGCLF